MINFDHLLPQDSRQKEEQVKQSSKDEQQQGELQAQNIPPPQPILQQYDETFTEQDKALIQAFMKTQTYFVSPPINDHVTKNAYRECFEKTIQEMTDHYVMFGAKEDLEKKMKLRPSRAVNGNLKGDLKISAYQIFNQLLDTFSKLSKDTREGANYNFKQSVIPFLKRFLRDIQQLRLYYLRKQIMAKIEQQIQTLKKETEQIQDVLDDMNKYVEENYEKSIIADVILNEDWKKQEDWDNVFN